MKLIMIFDESYNSNKRLLPRDIRNYLGSITKENKDLNQIVMWHERKQPTFIYSMPNPKSAAVYSFKNDDMTIFAMEALKQLIEKNPQLYINDQVLNIKEVFISNYDYSPMKSGLYERRLRTPLVIACGDYEYARARNLSSGDKLDTKELENMTREIIIESVRFQTRDWFDTEIDISNALIKFKDLEYTPIKYKEDTKEYYAAVRGTIISNIELPQFLGYKCGLGYGELSTLKEMDRRRKVK